MENNSPDLTRSQSLPVLNREEAVVKKIQEHEGIISLMQTQIELQSDMIAKHDKVIADLLAKVEELTSQTKTLEEALNKQSDSADQNAAKSALWSSSSKTTPNENQLSLADLVKETAEQTLGTDAAESGYIYDEKLGLYFDQASGYYYDPVKQLFYNGHTKTYYSYDSATNTYLEVQVVSESAKRKKRERHRRTRSKHRKYADSPNSDRNNPSSPPASECVAKEESNSANDDNIDNHSSGSRSPHKKSLSDMEEGEISSSLPTSVESSPCPVQSSDNENQANYPPCIRAVVQSAPSPLKKGTLFLIPCTGGTIGSLKSSNIYLPFSFVKKTHAKIEYQAVQQQDLNENEEQPEESTYSSAPGKYLITDMGSEEGTYVNRNRLSETGVQSEPHELVHGSTITIGEISLLIHIHPGDFTCGHCEPGLLLQKDPMYAYTAKTPASSRNAELKKVKKKYGLDRKTANTPSGSNSEANYKDRANERRVKIGSDNPFAKTEVASAEVPISDSNKGFKMMQKMGWKGESLGSKENEGITEPISCDLKTDRVGLGFQGPSLPSPPRDKSSAKKSKELAKTIERFNEASKKSSEDAENLEY